MKYQLFKTSQFICGWINYFGVANCYQLCLDLDHWIRRRVRIAYWRQWRKPRTKVRNLMKRGVRVQSAVACGITSTNSGALGKVPWRSPKTPGINQALSNAYLVGPEKGHSIPPNFQAGRLQPNNRIISSATHQHFY